MTIDISIPLARQPRYLRVAEAAAYARVTTRTMQRWIAAGLVKATKPSVGIVLVNRNSLGAHIGEMVG